MSYGFDTYAPEGPGLCQQQGKRFRVIIFWQFYS